MHKNFPTIFTAVVLSFLAACSGGGGGNPAPAPVPVTPAAPQIRLLAGIQGEGEGYADGSGVDARFKFSMGVAVAADGSVYVADTRNGVIRKVTQSGLTTTVAGQPGVFAIADGIGSAARFNFMIGIIVEPTGNLLVTDSCTIRRVTPAGQVSTIAGSATSCNLPDVQPDSSIVLSWLAADRSGQLYAASTRAIYKVAANGNFLPLAGGYGKEGSVDGTGAAATFSNINGLVADSAGNLFATEGIKSIIRKISPQGAVTTFAGVANAIGNVDAAGAGARFGVPSGLAIDSADNLYVTDSSNGTPDYSNHTVRKVTPSAVVTTIAGVAGSPGSADGPALSAQFRAALGIAAGANGDLFVNDTGNATIRKISGGKVTTLAGRAASAGSTDGAAVQARFWNPIGVIVDSAGNRYIADTNNHAIRKITAGGVVSTYAGLPGRAGLVDGPAATARFSAPMGLALDSANNLYVADFGNEVIRKITAGGAVSTVLNTTGGITLSAPMSVAVDSSGNLFVADWYDDIVYKGTQDGILSVLAGARIDIRDQNGRRNGRTSLDGVGTQARFNSMVGIVIDGSGNLFVSERAGQAVRKITPGGTVTTVGVRADTVGLPGAIAIDPSGTLYVYDNDRARIQKITAAGVVSTYAGGLIPAVAAKPGPLPGNVGTIQGIATSASGLVFTSENAVWTIEP